MPEPIFFRVKDTYAPTSGSEETIRLPSWPLSFLTITIKRVQPAANANVLITDLVAPIARIAVYVRGASVFDMDGVSAFVTGSLLYGRKVPLVKRSQANAASRHIATIYIPFSRKPLLPTSGIKAVGVGDNLLYLRWGTVPSGYTVQVDAIGWRENEPEWTVRALLSSQSVAATGDFDVILAPAGPIFGFIFNEDNPLETADTTLLGELRFLVQGVEDTLVSVDLESLFSLSHALVFPAHDLADHLHTENTASAYTPNALTLAQHPANTTLQRYIPLILDELYDPDAILAVPPGVDVRLRGRATATGTLRIITLEMFTIPERPTAAPA